MSIEWLYKNNNNPVVYIGTDTPHLQMPGSDFTFCGRPIPVPVQIGLSYSGGCQTCLKLVEKARIRLCAECGENLKEKGSNWCYGCKLDFVNASGGEY